jgi:hypothetical protein
MRPFFSSIADSMSGCADSMMIMNISIINAKGTKMLVISWPFSPPPMRPPLSCLTSPRFVIGTAAVARATIPGSSASVLNRRARTDSLIADSSQRRSSENCAAVP